MEKKTTTSNSAEQIGYSEDLLMEILLRIPPKSLLQLKLVSKQWRSLISSTSFRLSQTRMKASLKPYALFIDTLSLASEIAVLPINPDDDVSTQ
ncbi:hypothetical protein COLO4_32988 [Corchorus olitorius]|uniref:F-box domain-containing protein n=1 Tax=Corchorus olitorius TaxID=93759 RepID=A0A1R3GX26_9ROSI|nr:hypothetical protein COLO4_32988 [Corchorus olitorius]